MKLTEFYHKLSTAFVTRYNLNEIMLKYNKSATFLDKYNIPQSKF